MKNEFTKLTKKIVYILPFFLLPFTMNGQWVFEITEPGGISGMYPMGIAQFGPQTSDTISGDIQLGDPALGCGSLSNDLSGSIGMLDRGDCTFVEKAQNAQDAGAIALIVCNTADQIINMPSSTGGGNITIQTILLQQSTCESIKAALDEGTVSVQFYRNQLEVIWGGVDEPNSTFDGGLNDWTTQIRSGFENSAEEDVFVWLEGGDVTEGLVSNEDNIINSPTAFNGAAGMNLDLNTTGGTVNPGQPPYPFYVAELISPVIDLSEIESPMALSFYQLYRNLNFVGGNDFKSALQLSTDGGATWGPIIVLNEEVEIQGRVNNQLTIPLPQDIVGAEEFRFKFVLSMDFYYWVIDDVVLTELPATNISASNTWNPLPSFATPENHIHGVDFEFGLNISNLGLDQDIINASVEIRDAETNELFLELLEGIENLPGGVDSFHIFDFSENLDLEPGSYILTYRIDAPGMIDFDYSDNTSTFLFKVTEELFAKEDPAVNSFTTSAFLSGQQDHNTTWFYGVPYYIAPQEGDKEVYLSHSEIALIVDDGEFTNESVALYLLEHIPDGASWTESIFDGSNDNPDLHNATDFVAIAVVDSLALRAAGSGNIVTVNVNQFLDPIHFDPVEQIMLNQDKVYFLVLAITQTNVPTIGVALNNVMDYSLSNQFIYARNQYFGSYSGIDNAPVIRMGVLDSPVSTLNRIENVIEPLLVYPVPASNELYIDFALERPTDMEIQLFDNQGRLMHSSQHHQVSTETIRTDVTEYHTGNYFIRVVTKNGVQTRQVLIVK